MGIQKHKANGALSRGWCACWEACRLIPDVHAAAPMALHYGLQINIVGGSGYSFDKHWAQGFDPGVCPPWRLPPSYNASVELAGGLFPHPPPASSFKTKARLPDCSAEPPALCTVSA